MPRLPEKITFASYRYIGLRGVNGSAVSLENGVFRKTGCPSTGESTDWSGRLEVHLQGVRSVIDCISAPVTDLVH